MAAKQNDGDIWKWSIQTDKYQRENGQIYNRGLSLLYLLPSSGLNKKVQLRLSMWTQKNIKLHDIRFCVCVILYNICFIVDLQCYMANCNNGSPLTCMSLAGFQSTSYKTRWEAPMRFSPTPPALELSSNRKLDECGLLKESTIRCRWATGVFPSSRHHL